MPSKLFKSEDRIIASLLKHAIAELSGNDSDQKYLLYCGILTHHIKEYDHDDRSHSHTERSTSVSDLTPLNKINDNYFQQLCDKFAMRRTSSISVYETEFIDEEPKWKSLQRSDFDYGDTG